jgi:hypothetical protein
MICQFYSKAQIAQAPLLRSDSVMDKILVCYVFAVLAVLLQEKFSESELYEQRLTEVMSLHQTQLKECRRRIKVQERTDKNKRNI